MADFELLGFVLEGAKKTPINLLVSEPVVSEESEDFYCTIRAPELLQDEKRIYGVDGQQARQLAFAFIKSLLGERRLVDNNGEPFDFDHLSK